MGINANLLTIIYNKTIINVQCYNFFAVAQQLG